MSDKSILAEDTRKRVAVHVAAVALMVVAVSLAHWSLPRGSDALHIVHVVLRKLYILPVVLAAVWFDLRGAVVAAGAVAMLYLPHVFVQWSADRAENINQAGELSSVMVVALLSGAFVGKEKSLLREIGSTYRNAVTALVRALDAREHGTEQHSLRVRAYTLRLARELGVPADLCQRYALGALLHDIGKIGVPDAILLKQGPLDDAEWATVKRHPESGYCILAPLPHLGQASDLVFSHHERFDGSGYPRGLVGDEIPMGARIFAGADVFDALTSPRPYRRQCPYSQARQMIRDGAGKDYDPKVVEAFLRVPTADWEGIAESVEKPGDEAVSAEDRPNTLGREKAPQGICSRLSRRS